MGLWLQARLQAPVEVRPASTLREQGAAALSIPSAARRRYRRLSDKQKWNRGFVHKNRLRISWQSQFCPEAFVLPAAACVCHTKGDLMQIFNT